MCVAAARRRHSFRGTKRCFALKDRQMASALRAEPSSWHDWVVPAKLGHRFFIHSHTASLKRRAFGYLHASPTVAPPLATTAAITHDAGPRIRYPTLADLAGIPVPPTCANAEASATENACVEGHSLAPLVNGAAPTGSGSNGSFRRARRKRGRTESQSGHDTHHRMAFLPPLFCSNVGGLQTTRRSVVGVGLGCQARSGSGARI